MSYSPRDLATNFALKFVSSLRLIKQKCQNEVNVTCIRLQIFINTLKLQSFSHNFGFVDKKIQNFPKIWKIFCIWLALCFAFQLNISDLMTNSQGKYPILRFYSIRAWAINDGLDNENGTLFGFANTCCTWIHNFFFNVSPP